MEKKLSGNAILVFSGPGVLDETGAFEHSVSTSAPEGSVLTADGAGGVAFAPSSTGLQSTTVILTADQLNGLSTETPIQLLPSPGPGLFYLFNSIAVSAGDGSYGFDGQADLAYASGEFVGANFGTLTIARNVINSAICSPIGGQKVLFADMAINLISYAGTPFTGITTDTKLSMIYSILPV